MKMNHFADAGKTNPNKPHFYQKSGKTCEFGAKNLEKLAYLVRKLAHLIRRFAEFPPDFPGYFVWTLPAFPLFV